MSSIGLFWAEPASKYTLLALQCQSNRDTESGTFKDNTTRAFVAVLEKCNRQVEQWRVKK
jgi:hypothetical protein